MNDFFCGAFTTAFQDFFSVMFYELLFPYPETLSAICPRNVRKRFEAGLVISGWFLPQPR